MLSQFYLHCRYFSNSVLWKRERVKCADLRVSEGSQEAQFGFGEGYCSTCNTVNKTALEMWSDGAQMWQL